MRTARPASMSSQPASIVVSSAVAALGFAAAEMLRRSGRDDGSLTMLSADGCC